jgi:hypothetical protein
MSAGCGLVRRWGGHPYPAATPQTVDHRPTLSKATPARYAASCSMSPTRLADRTPPCLTRLPGAEIVRLPMADLPRSRKTGVIIWDRSEIHRFASPA